MQEHFKAFKDFAVNTPLRSVVTLEWVRAVQELLKALARGDNITVESGLVRGYGERGVRIGQRRKFVRKGGAVTDCPFGKIVTIPADGATPAGKGIAGGVVFAGPNIWHMEPNELNLAASGEWLVWLDVGITASSYEGVPYPGIDASTEPTWDKGSVAGGYPDMTMPTSAEPSGTAIVPLGKLTIADGAAKFEPVACGAVIIEHCANSLSIKRGNAPDYYGYY